MRMRVYIFYICAEYTCIHLYIQVVNYINRVNVCSTLILGVFCDPLRLLVFQIDRQLQTYLQRVEAVLGKGWESHVEGQKLKQDGDSFRQKLNTQQLFDDWKKKVEARQLVVQGRIFNIVSQRTRTGTILKLQVNFTPETITLAKEVCDTVYSH